MALSEKYFYHHYKKLSSELTESEQQQQNKYTKREANYIAKDPVYREMLLEDFVGELPKGFEQMDKLQQDYELAMLALDNRLILNVPRKKNYWKNPRQCMRKNLSRLYSAGTTSSSTPTLIRSRYLSDPNPCLLSPEPVPVKPGTCSCQARTGTRTSSKTHRETGQKTFPNRHFRNSQAYGLDPNRRAYYQRIRRHGAS